jgi:hypothetical protein
MKRRRRLAIAGFTATAVAAAIAAIALSAPTALANVSGPTFATPNNASDPHVIKCNNPDSNNVAGYCLYTSQDMGPDFVVPAGCLPSSCDNYYPMVQTRVYFSTTGYNNWEYKGIAWEEWKMDTAHGGFVEPDSRHLWAPSAVKVGSTYYLYVPDVADNGSGGIGNDSRIAVLSSNNPFRDFTYRGTLPYDSGYMSDPDVVVVNNGGVTQRLVIWADGDFATCGGFKWARLNSDMLTFATTPQPITISGISVLGNCGGTGRPYVEGGSLYKFGYDGVKPFTLLFAAKPTSVPTDCNSTNAAPGSAQTANSVIAWASANGPTDNQPWVWSYKSIVICGSASTDDDGDGDLDGGEWTNQATLTTTSNGRGIIIFHDGPGAPNRQRKLHAECLFIGGGKIAGVYRQPLDAANGFNTCTTTSNNEYGALRADDAQVSGAPPIISANNGSGELRAKRYAVGPWERFKMVLVAGTTNTYVFLSMFNGKYLCATSTTAALAPSCASTDLAARFDWAWTSAVNAFKLRSQLLGTYLSVDNVSGVYKLRASATDTTGAAVLAWMTPGGGGAN